MILLFIILFQGADTLFLKYNDSISFKIERLVTLEDNLSRKFDFEMDSSANIYVFDYQPNTLNRYKIKTAKIERIGSTAISSFNLYLFQFNDFLFMRGDSNQIFDRNLNRLQTVPKPDDVHLLSIGNFADRTRAVFKTSMFRHSFYTIDLDNSFQLLLETKQEFPVEQSSHFRYVNGLLIENSRLIQVFAKRYLIEIVDSNNGRKLYSRTYKHIKQLIERDRVIYTKGSGIVSNQFVTNNMNGYYNGKFQDDIFDIMGSHNGYYFIKTSRSDENRLEFDIVNFKNRTFRHFFKTFPDHVNSAKVRYGKLLVEIRDKKQGKLIIYDIL